MKKIFISLVIISCIVFSYIRQPIVYAGFKTHLLIAKYEYFGDKKALMMHIVTYEGEGPAIAKLDVFSEWLANENIKLSTIASDLRNEEKKVLELQLETLYNLKNDRQINKDTYR